MDNGNMEMLRGRTMYMKRIKLVWCINGVQKGDLRRQKRCKRSDKDRVKGI